MANITWKYVKPLHDEKAVDVFLDRHHISLPEGLKACITQNNGGRPSEKLFDTQNGCGYVFKSLLSYNKDDSENIYAYYPDLFGNTTLFPIGMDASGDFICYDRTRSVYVLYMHESGQSADIIALVALQ